MMLQILGLLLVAAAVFYWLSVIYRGAWKYVVAAVIGLLSWICTLVIKLTYVIGGLLIVWAIVRLDLSAFAGALVAFAAARLFEFLFKHYGPWQLAIRIERYFEARKAKRKSRAHVDPWFRHDS